MIEAAHRGLEPNSRIDWDTGNAAILGKAGKVLGTIHFQHNNQRLFLSNDPRAEQVFQRFTQLAGKAEVKIKRTLGYGHEGTVHELEGLEGVAIKVQEQIHGGEETPVRMLRLQDKTGTRVVKPFFALTTSDGIRYEAYEICPHPTASQLLIQNADDTKFCDALLREIAKVHAKTMTSGIHMVDINPGNVFFEVTPQKGGWAFSPIISDTSFIQESAAPPLGNLDQLAEIIEAVTRGKLGLNRKPPSSSSSQ